MTKTTELQKYIDDCAEMHWNSSTGDVIKTVQRDLKGYKTVHYALFGKKPHWYSMDDIDAITDMIAARIEKDKDERADVDHG